MAIKKKAAKAVKKPASKPAAKGGKQATAKKSAPKKAAKPSGPKAASKAKPPKKDAKPVAKKVSKPAAKNSKPVKPSKPLAKKEVPVSKAPVKPVPPEKPTAQPVAAKPVAPQVKSLVSTPPPPPRPVPKKEPAKPTKVVIPEIKTKSSVKYQPEFTKSVLDTPLQHIQTGPTMRYSDAELVEFKEIILKKLDAAKKELAYLQGLITRKDEMGGDESENRYMTMEDGSMSMEREQLSQMASRQITFIDHLEKALMRIENKTYGICRVTGKLIDKARLRAVPHATLSIEAKQTMNK
ncbi:MAG TPA: TraR/DksA C4-type zinc finger protein [Chitinophagaceae bacterium]|nr:TraR/DksA C4-type zinc finger protein [Chitinophagaceae bacterium]